MAKAICTRRLVSNFPFIIIEEGEVVDYTVKDKKFVVRGVSMHSVAFFKHFKVTEGIDKMSYSDFEYILCNYVFTMAMLYPVDIGNGERYLIIKDWDTKRIFIYINEKENAVHVSFNRLGWATYTGYEAALESIRNHEWRSAVDEAPAVDAVKVVRCKDCRRCDEYESLGKGKYLGCNLAYYEIHEVDPEHYCSYGERR